MLSYGDKTTLGSLRIGDSFEKASNVYHIDDEARMLPLYIVTPVGRMARQNGQPQFVKFGRRNPQVLEKSLVVKQVFGV